MERHGEVSTVTSSSALPLGGQRSKFENTSNGKKKKKKTMSTCWASVDMFICMSKSS